MQWYLHPHLLQSIYKLYMKFSYIKPIKIFAIQIYDISVGNSTFSRNGQELIVLPPLKRLFSHQTIVGSVEILNKVVGKIQRKSSVGGHV